MFTASKLKLEAISSQRAKHRCSLGFLFYVYMRIKICLQGFCTLCSLNTSLRVKAMSEKSCQCHIITQMWHTRRCGQEVESFLCVCVSVLSIFVGWIINVMAQPWICEMWYFCFLLNVRIGIENAPMLGKYNNTMLSQLSRPWSSCYLCTLPV